MVSEAQKERFAALCEAAVAVEGGQMGIGTLGEKTMHRVLKYFFCPDANFHEVGLGSFVADVVVDDVIYEIQTGGFYPLRKKLAYYLERGDKTVVIAVPVIGKKRLLWIDPETGESVGQPRARTQPRAHMRVLRELFRLCDLLDFSRVTLCLICVEADEYRMLDGYGQNKKTKATKIEKIPRALLDLIDLASAADVARVFLPDSLPSPFTSAEFSRLTGAKRRALSADLYALEKLGVIERAGKKGNAVLFAKVEQK